MELNQKLKQVKQLLKTSGISTFELDSELVFGYVLNKDRGAILAHSDMKLNMKELREIDRLTDLRAQHIPIAYIFGKKEFYGLDFVVNTDVLIPRPESETIVEYTLEHAPKNSTVLDVGTGSGALAVAIKKHRPDLRVYASDISDQALAVARRNAQTHQVDIAFVVSDLLASIDIQPDWIVANLPYVPSETDLNASARHEPRIALLAGQSGLELYLELFEQLTTPAFNTVGCVVIEANPDQHRRLRANLNSWSMNQLTYFVSVLSR